MTDDKKKQIQDLIKSHSVFLFMKGTPDQPMCGFSMQAAAILKKITDDFGYYNVLDDEEMREAIKEYSDWPTLPQLYIEGEFVGGCDIITELFETGELEKMMSTSNS